MSRSELSARPQRVSAWRSRGSCGDSSMGTGEAVHDAHEPSATAVAAERSPGSVPRTATPTRLTGCDGRCASSARHLFRRRSDR